MEVEIFEDFCELTFVKVCVKKMSRPSLSEFFNMYANSEMTRSMFLLYCFIVAELSIKKIWSHLLASFDLERT